MKIDKRRPRIFVSCNRAGRLARGIVLLAGMLLASGCTSGGFFRAAPVFSQVSSSQASLAATYEQGNEPSPGVAALPLPEMLRQVDLMPDLPHDLREELKQALGETRPELWESTIGVYRSVAAFRRNSAPPESVPLPSLPDHANLVVAGPPPAFSAEDFAELERLPPADLPAHTVRHLAEEELDFGGPLRQEIAAFDENRELVQQAAYHVAEPIPPIDWREILDDAIAALEVSSGDGTATQQQAILRLLQLAADRPEEALREIEGLEENERRLWRGTLESLAVWLDSAPENRSALACERLRRVAQELESRESRPLKIRNLKFCSQVQSYGVYQEIHTPAFSPGEEILLYAELEHLQAQPSAQGFRTCLKSRYQLFDPQGTCIAAHDFPETVDQCQNRRRDFFMRYFLWLPADLAAGTYRLELEIVDALAGCTARSSVELAIR